MIIRVIDFETTGMEPPAEVCEIGWVDLLPVLGTIEWGVNHYTHSRLCRVSSMPPEVRAVHHITMEDVEDEVMFDPDEVLVGMPDILAAHNADFERRWLGSVATMPWICPYKCALRVWPDAPGHSNQVLRYWLEDQGLLSLDADKAMPPHRAGPDAYVTAHILLALLKVATVEQMIEWTKEPRLLPRCTIGKFRGKPWAEVERGFLNWMLQQPTMEEDLKWNARREIERRASAASK